MLFFCHENGSVLGTGYYLRRQIYMEDVFGPSLGRV